LPVEAGRVLLGVLDRPPSRHATGVDPRAGLLLPLAVDGKAAFDAVDVVDDIEIGAVELPVS